MLNLINYIYLCILVSFCFPRILLISDSYSHPLQELSIYFESTEENISIIYYDNCNIIDTLSILTENDLIFWIKDNEFTNAEKNELIEFNYLGGSLVLFGKSIFEDPYFFIEEFGGTYLRDVNAENLLIEDEEIYFDNAFPKAELQLISNFGNILSVYEDNSISSIAKINDSNVFILNGFWLEEIIEIDRQLFINYILDIIKFKSVIIELESIEAESNDSIFINLYMDNDQSVSEINAIINIESDYLYQFLISSTERSMGMDWEIIDLPFGNIKLIAELDTEIIQPGQESIAIIQAISNENALGKIAIQFLENTILDSIQNEIPVISINGDITFNMSSPQVYFTGDNSIILGESKIMELELNNEMEISGLQLCLLFESSELLFVRADPTERIPEDWWVGQFGQGSNDEIQIASLGFSTILPGNGPILTIEMLSIGEVDSTTSIIFCNSYLFSESSEYLDIETFNEEINIMTPGNIINPVIINSENYTDILYVYNTTQHFNGFQIDININFNEMYQLFGYYESYITGNIVNGTSYRVLGFNEIIGQNYPESGTLFTISFNYLNSLENNVDHDNLMFSDNQGEIVYSLINPPIVNVLSSGDIDGNGELDIKDLLIIQSHIVNELEIGKAQNEIADVELNGNVDIMDVIKIIQILSM